MLDEIREERIEMEIIVDTYNEEESAMGWYYYLQDKLDFPFNAKSSKGDPLSNEILNIIGMADESECLGGMYVLVAGDEQLVMALEKIEPITLDPDSKEAIDDWKYWVKMGYNF